MKVIKDSLKDSRVAVELVSGERLFGCISRWSENGIWIIKDGSKKSIIIPMDMIVRSFIVFDGVNVRKFNAS